MADDNLIEEPEVTTPASEPEPITKTASGLELNERELALCRGEDPDTAHAAEPSEGDDEQAASRDTSGRFTKQGDQATDGTNGNEGKDAADRPISNAPDWADEDIKALASSYGMKDEHLRHFADAKAFLNAAATYDQGQAALSRTATPNSPAVVPAQPNAQTEPPVKSAVAKTQATPDAAAKQASPFERIDRTKFVAAGYGDDEMVLVDQHNALLDYIEKQNTQLSSIMPAIEQMQQQQAREHHQARINAFHESVDVMDEARYGRTVDAKGNYCDLNPIHDNNRRQLYEAELAVKKVIEDSAATRGEQPVIPPRKVMLRRAEMMLYGSDILDAQIKAHEEKISKQSQRRRPAAQRSMRPGSSPTSSVMKVDKEVDPAAEVANNPAVVEAWNRMQEENGHR